MAASHETVWQGTLLLGVYSLGLAIPFLAAGWSIEYFFRVFGRVKKHFRALEVGSGLILMGVGLLLVTDQLGRLNARFAFLTGFIGRLEQMLQ